MIIGRSDKEIKSKGLGLAGGRFETFPVKALENGFTIRYKKPGSKKRHVSFNDEEQPGAR